MKRPVSFIISILLLIIAISYSPKKRPIAVALLCSAADTERRIHSDGDIRGEPYLDTTSPPPVAAIRTGGRDENCHATARTLLSNSLGMGTFQHNVSTACTLKS